MNPQRSTLSNHQELFSWGPIQLVIGAQADSNHPTYVIEQAHNHAWARFEQVLPELVAELPTLKQAVQIGQSNPLQGRIARRMWQACQPFLPQFITPMAAVAGAVADEIIQSYQINGIGKAWVNNGGDIAVHLAAHQTIPIGICADSYRAYDKIQAHKTFTLDGQLSIASKDPVRGIATSGWQGRSFSMGIADSVTVLATTAACADAAASIIANAVNVDDGRIVRRKACDMKDDSDLGEHLVTVHVPTLEYELIEHALENGLMVAQKLKDQGLIWGAILSCQQQVHYVMDQTLATPIPLMHTHQPSTQVIPIM